MMIEEVTEKIFICEKIFSLAWIIMIIIIMECYASGPKLTVIITTAATIVIIIFYAILTL